MTDREDALEDLVRAIRATGTHARRILKAPSVLEDQMPHWSCVSATAAAIPGAGTEDVSRGVKVREWWSAGRLEGDVEGPFLESGIAVVSAGTRRYEFSAIRCFLSRFDVILIIIIIIRRRRRAIPGAGRGWRGSRTDQAGRGPRGGRSGRRCRAWLGRCGWPREGRNSRVWGRRRS